MSAPTVDRSRRRVIAVDVARCLALVGMVMAHLAGGADPSGPGGVTAAHHVVSGRSAALFAVLAGVSIALVTRQAQDSDRRVLVTRAAAVAGLGLVLGLLGSGVAVILTYYGVLFCVALPLLRWSPRALFSLAAGLAVVTPVLSLLVRDVLPDRSLQVPSLVSLANPWQLFTELTVTGYYPVLTWSTYLVAGLAVGRLDLGSRAVALRLTAVGALLALVSLRADRRVRSQDAVREELLTSWDTWDRPSVASWEELEVVIRTGLYGVHPTGSPWWLGIWSPHSGTVVDLLHTTGCALLVLGLLLLVVPLGGPRITGVWRVVGGAGTMTLTLYTLHVLVLSLPEEVPGSHVLAVHLVALLGVGAAYAALDRRGPLESVVGELAASARRPGGP